jgi:membrane-bound serine protease (ClpP class)
VAWTVLIPAVTITSLFFAAVITMALKAQLRKKVTGSEGMIGAVGKAITDIQTGGKVLVMGEYWEAWSDDPIAQGSSVKVLEIKGLKLKVEKKKEEKPL